MGCNHLSDCMRCGGIVNDLEDDLEVCIAEVKKLKKLIESDLYKKALESVREDLMRYGKEGNDLIAKIDRVLKGEKIESPDWDSAIQPSCELCKFYKKDNNNSCNVCQNYRKFVGRAYKK